MFVYTAEHMKIHDPEVRSSKHSPDKVRSSNPVTPTLTSLLRKNGLRYTAPQSMATR